MRGVRLEVRGRVQGVGFRWFAKDVARRCDLAGWVRNREDGTVEIAACGHEESLQSFIDRLRRGPPGALVDEVRELPLAGEEALARPFTIVR